MNKILNEVKVLIDDSISKYLPNIKNSDLEGNGSIYYMNGRNGTECDWYVNGHISDFMVFYDDEAKMGALKLTLYSNGDILIYIYGDQGKEKIKEIKTSIKTTPKDILDLAVILKYEADDKSKFDDSIDRIDSDIKVSKERLNMFKSEEKHFENLRARKNLFNQAALVSEKIAKEDYKVGYMVRYEPHDETDSGWQFLAGNEDDTYLNEQKHVVLMPLGYVCNLDSDISKYIESPVGTELIRVSSSEFEIDKHNKEIHIEKREK